jgi:hypothetical protein
LPNVHCVIQLKDVRVTIIKVFSLQWTFGNLSGDN